MECACLGIESKWVGVDAFNEEISGPEADQEAATEPVDPFDVPGGMLLVMDQGFIGAHREENDARVSDAADEL